MKRKRQHAKIDLKCSSQRGHGDSVNRQDLKCVGNNISDWLRCDRAVARAADEWCRVLLDLGIER